MVGWCRLFGRKNHGKIHAIGGQINSNNETYSFALATQCGWCFQSKYQAEMVEIHLLERCFRHFQTTNPPGPVFFLRKVLVVDSGPPLLVPSELRDGIDWAKCSWRSWLGVNCEMQGDPFSHYYILYFIYILLYIYIIIYILYIYIIIYIYYYYYYIYI